MGRGDVNTLTITRRKLSECLRASKIIKDNEEVAYMSRYSPEGHFIMVIEKVWEKIKEK